MTQTTIEFIGIGAQKAATTWIARNFQLHPDIWMPPRKELHYFDRSFHYPSHSFLSESNPYKRLLGLGEKSYQFHKRFYWSFLDEFKRNEFSLTNLRWQFKYYLGSCSDEWYLSLFEGGQGKTKGEITPDYSILNLNDVQRIANLLPDVKIIYMLRNPVERAWSQVRFSWTLGKFKHIDDLNQVKKFIDSPFQMLRNDYLGTIKTWKSCFPENQIYIGFYDDVIENPGWLMSEIFRFIQVDPNKFNYNSFGDSVNASKKQSIPPEIEQYLARKYLPDLEQLADTFQGHTIKWRDEVKKMI